MVSPGLAGVLLFATSVVGPTILPSEWVATPYLPPSRKKAGPNALVGTETGGLVSPLSLTTITRGRAHGHIGRREEVDLPRAHKIDESGLSR